MPLRMLDVRSRRALRTPTEYPHRNSSRLNEINGKTNEPVTPVDTDQMELCIADFRKRGNSSLGTDVVTLITTFDVSRPQDFVVSQPSSVETLTHSTAIWLACP